MDTLHGDLTEMVELLAEALYVAWGELLALKDTPCPLPDEIVKKISERDALAATFETLPEELKAGLRYTYKAELKKAEYQGSDLSCPVDDEVIARLEADVEVLRRRSMVVPELREAARRLSP